MKSFFNLMTVLILSGCATPGASLQEQIAATPVVVASSDCSLSKAHAVSCKLGRGINLGNALDAPLEGDWGLRISEPLFDRIAEAGFATMRLPVRWSNHADATAPYTIDPEFFARVDYAVDAALKRGLYVVLNMQHYQQLNGDTLQEHEFVVPQAVLEDRAVAMWQQIARHYQDRSPKLLFELFNEPRRRLTAQKWNALAERMLAAVRTSNPDRVVVIGPGESNNPKALQHLILPQDPYLIATVHHYEPFDFTHQGADFIPGASAWLGRSCCNAAQYDRITGPLNQTAQWSAANRVPVWVGEFGSYERVPMEYRAIYTRLVRDEIEKRGMRWAYWELASCFGIYDESSRQWKTPLREALMGQ